MKLATIEASPEEAKAKLDEYRAAVKVTHEEADTLIMKGYQALSEGKALINLPDSMRRGGWDEHQLPRLGIGRMTDERIRVRFNGPEVKFYPSTLRDGWSGPQNDRAGLNAGVVKVEPWVRPPAPDANTANPARRASMAEAIVPLVPPALRPKRAKHRYFVLFEADWRLIPPRDPALIRHLIGDLWVVLSTWDLTELERAAIAGR